VLYDKRWQLAEAAEIHANAVLHPGSQLGAGLFIQSNAVDPVCEGFGFVPTPSGWWKMPQTGRVVLEGGGGSGLRASTIDRPPRWGEPASVAGHQNDNLACMWAMP